MLIPASRLTENASAEGAERNQPPKGMMLASAGLKEKQVCVAGMEQQKGLSDERLVVYSNAGKSIRADCESYACAVL